MRSKTYKAEQRNSPADEGGKQAGNSIYTMTCKDRIYFDEKQEKNSGMGMNRTNELRCVCLAKIMVNRLDSLTVEAMKSGGVRDLSFQVTPNLMRG